MRNRIGTVHGVREFRGEARNKQKWIVRTDSDEERAAEGASGRASERERKRAG